MMGGQKGPHRAFLNSPARHVDVCSSVQSLCGWADVSVEVWVGVLVQRGRDEHVRRVMEGEKLGTDSVPYRQSSFCSTLVGTVQNELAGTIRRNLYTAGNSAVP